MKRSVSGQLDEFQLFGIMPYLDTNMGAVEQGGLIGSSFPYLALMRYFFKRNLLAETLSVAVENT